MERGYEVLEWVIENFCSYDEQIHDLFIESPKVVHGNTTTFKLYPKGLLCKDGVLSVRINNISRKEFFGDLSLVTADGNILWWHLLRWQSDIFEGPKYEDVVTHVRKTRKDRVTLLVRFRSRKQVLHVVRTVIDGSNISFKLGPSIIDRLIKGQYLPTHTDIANIKCLMNGTMMTLQSRRPLDAPKGYDAIEFVLIPKSPKSEFLARSRVTLRNAAGIDLKTEENRRFIRNNKTWAFLNSPLKKSEITDVSLIIAFVIIGGDIRTSHTETSCVLEEVVGPRPKIDLAGCFRPVESPPSGLSEDLKRLYQKRKYTDLILKYDGVPFPVHKNIISARSPVFESMLSTWESGEVDVDDMDVPTLSQFLIYLYTGLVEDVREDCALKLYHMAVKYKVPSLKKTCSDLLGRNISLSNVCDILSLADRYQDNVLTKAVLIFMLKNHRHVVGSKNWNSFLERQPLLAARTLTVLAKKKYVVRGNGH